MNQEHTISTLSGAAAAARVPLLISRLGGKAHGSSRPTSRSNRFFKARYYNITLIYLSTTRKPLKKMLPKVVIGCREDIHGYNYNLLQDLELYTYFDPRITFSGFVQMIVYGIGLTTYLTKFSTSIGTLFYSVRHPLTKIKIKQNYVSWKSNFSKHLCLYRTLSIVPTSYCLYYSRVIMVRISYC